MSHARLSPVLVLLLFVPLSAGSGVSVDAAPSEPLLVGLAHDRALPAIGTTFADAVVTDSFPRLHAIRLTPPSGMDSATFADQVAGLPAIRYAAPEPVLTAATHIQEPRLKDQGHHIPIHSATAWHLSIGSSDVRLAIIDSGLDAAHEEFTGRIVAARDFLDDDATAQDDCGHGTAITGLAAAHPDNKKGGAGIAAVSLLIARVLEPEGNVCTGPLADAAEALLWAADQGARVVLMSLASNSDHPALSEAVATATAQGVVIVAAGGNTNGGIVQYPAAYPDVIAVGSTRNDKTLSTFSPAGPVDLVAPGEDLLTTTLKNKYGRVTGTSAAAPLVAGTAALMASIAPNITHTQVRTFLQQSATDIREKGYDAASGHGVLNVVGAADRARDLVNTAPWLGAYGAARVKVGHTFTYTPSSYDRNGDLLTFTGTGLPPESTLDSATGRLTWTPRSVHIGTYAYTITVSDGQAEAWRSGTLEAYPNPPPKAVLTGPTRVDARTAATFDASGSSDPDKTALQHAWDDDLTDGPTYMPGAATATFVWPTPGRYTVAARVTDADGDHDVATQQVVVDDILVGEPAFEPTYGVRDRIRGALLVDWIGGDDRTRIQVQVQRYPVAADGQRTGSVQTFMADVPANGTVLIDLDPDVGGVAGRPGRNVPGTHELVLTATLEGSANGDTERWQRAVRYTVPVS